MALRFLNSGYFAGKVGIGTDSPGAVLSVRNPTAGTSTFSLQHSTTSSIFDFQTGIANVTGNALLIKDVANSYDYLTLRDGSVGIGTTSPAGKLDIQGTQGQLFSVTDDLSGEIFAVADVSGVPIMTVNSSGVSYFDGDVGIGTSIPSYKLHVDGQVKIESTNYEMLYLHQADANGGFIKFTNTDDTDGWYTGITGSEKFIISRTADNTAPIITVEQNGNVGIGTSSPAGKLTVADGETSGVSKTAIEFIPQDAHNRNIIFSYDRVSGVYRDLDIDANDVHFNNGGTEKMRITSAGNVGIGTTNPSHKLDVAGTTRSSDYLAGGAGGAKGYEFGSSGSGPGVANMFAPSSFTLGFGTNNVERVRITSTGNVGIGTTTPDFGLEVDGTFGVSDLPFNTDSVSVLVADETIGAELITNGDFDTNTDWTLTANVAISGGKLNFTNATTNTHYANQVISAPVGSVYKITLEVSNLGSGESIKIRFPFQDTSINANGTYTIVSEGTTANAFRITPASATATFSIDNVSVKQVTSASNQVQKRELGTGAFGPTPVGAYLPLAGGTMTGTAGVLMPDNFKLKFGDATTPDLQIYHNGSNSYINDAGTGDLYIQASDNMYFQTYGSGKRWITLTENAGVDLFYNDIKRFETTAGGTINTGTIDSTGTITVTGANGNVGINTDTGKLLLGASYDLQIFHDGSNSYVSDVGTGSLILMGTDLQLKSAGDEFYMYADADGQVSLYHNGIKKFETGSTGVSVIGNINVDSALISNQENTDIDTGAEVVAQVVIATYTAAFFDFVVKKGTNVRSGTVYACHDGTDVEFTETSTQDLGDTSDVVLSVDISGGYMRLLATVASDDWSVKSLIRAI